MSVEQSPLSPMAFFQGRIERGEVGGCSKALLSRPWRILECRFDRIPDHFAQWYEVCSCDGPYRKSRDLGPPMFEMQVHHLRRSEGQPAVVAIGQCWHCKTVSFAELRGVE